tara:strand:- start:193 stop:477 length:285 start_codon:yes stop_codon:yes gene_type:complete
MNIYTRKLRASSNIFSGFEINIDIRYYDTVDGIIKHFHNELLSVFKKYNLEVLYEQCLKSNFHIHTHNFEEILLLDCYDIVYLCDNCHLQHLQH